MQVQYLIIAVRGDIMSSFINLYNDLSSTGLFFFWIVIILFIFLIILSIVLIVKNRKLSKIVNNSINEEEISVVENNILDNDKKEIEELKNNVVEEKEELPILDEEKKEVKEEKINLNKEPVQEEKIEKTQEVNKGLYQKNVLRQINARMQTSPINISRNVETEEYDEFTNNIKEESMISPLEEMEDLYSVNDNMKFATEAIKRMEEEANTSNNIELTEYEKKQEEEAIISYDELLKVKDKIYNITDDEETDEFIDELKNFRLDLE